MNTETFLWWWESTCREWASYPLIGLMDDVVRESLRHLAGSVLASLQGVVEVTLWGGGYHRGNKRSDSSRGLRGGKRIQFLIIQSPHRLNTNHNFMNEDAVESLRKKHVSWISFRTVHFRENIYLTVLSLGGQLEHAPLRFLPGKFKIINFSEIIFSSHYNMIKDSFQEQEVSERVGGGGGGLKWKESKHVFCVLHMWVKIWINLLLFSADRHSVVSRAK